MQYGMSAEQRRIKWAARSLWRRLRIHTWRWKKKMATKKAQREQSVGWRSVLTEPEWTGASELLPHSHRRCGRAARVMQAPAEANSHFPASKKPAALQCLKSWQPRLSLCSATWPRIHCGGAASTDCRGIAFCSVSAFKCKSEHRGHRCLWRQLSGRTRVFDAMFTTSTITEAGWLGSTKAPPTPFSFLFHSPRLNSFHFPGSYLALSNLLTSLVITTRALYPADPLLSIKPRTDLSPISTNWRTRP